MNGALAKGIPVSKRRETEGATDPDHQLIQELAQIRQDRRLVIQIARLVSLSRELRARLFSGRVTLHFGSGLVNTVRQEEVIDWRDREAS